ncbi:MAG: hypothetical protein ACREOQ_04615 [Gemmatimonadales bacterium]
MNGRIYTYIPCVNWTMGSNGGAATRLTHSSFIDTMPVYSH